MAFIVLRRSRNTRNYYLVESYRDDQGETRRCTLCYLGREQDGTDTLAKALAHWEKAMEQAKREIRKARGEPRQVIRRRIEATVRRIGVINDYIQMLARTEAERRNGEQQAEEKVYWQSFEQLRRNPTEENAMSAKRAFLLLAKRHHPDQGGTHHDFLRLKDAYDRALAVWRRAAA
jgi:chromosome segregation ATPase